MKIAWLLNDFNAAASTIGAVEHFCEKVLSGGVMLSDKYAFHGRVEKMGGDTFSSQKNQLSSTSHRLLTSSLEVQNII